MAGKTSTGEETPGTVKIETNYCVDRDVPLKFKECPSELINNFYKTPKRGG